MTAYDVHDVTLSTKTWEGDYRHVMTAAGLDRLFRPFGPAGPRQLVINNVSERARVEALARELVASGSLDRFAFAEDAWPGVAGRLRLPVTWFGPAWPYSVPELVELDLATTPVLAHLAGDVALEVDEPWLPRALRGLASGPDVNVVSAASPSRADLVGGVARSDGWVISSEFSDQLFVCRPADLLRGEVLRAEHWRSGFYPKPGGALTFEARVGAWQGAHGKVRLTDARCSYRHPVWGEEGASYAGAGFVPGLAPLAAAGPSYPQAGSVDATGLIIVRNGERTIGQAVASLGWCRRVVVHDQQSEDRTAERARAAGAEVRSGPVTGVVEIARRTAVEDVGTGWVVMLDDDELLPGPLARRLAEVMTGDVDGVRIARRNMLFGRWAAGAGWWPDPQLRVFRADAVRLSPVVHSAIALDDPGRLMDLVAEGVARPEDLAMLHFNYEDLTDWFERMNRYTTLQSRTAALERPRAAVQLVRSTWERFVTLGGWRMGRYGFDISVLGAAYDWLLYKKIDELTRGGGVAVSALYDEISEQVLRR